MMKAYLIGLVCLLSATAAIANENIKILGNVKPNSTISFNYNFQAGIPVVVEFRCIGDDNRDPDLWIYDNNKKLVVKSTNNGCMERAYFIPPYTGKFEIQVENKNKPLGAKLEMYINIYSDIVPDDEPGEL